LKGFAEKRLVSVYDQSTGLIDALTSKTAATIEHFYTFIDESDRRRFEMEALFGIVESRGGTELRHAVSIASLSVADREHLALFAAMHAIQTPAALAESRSARERAEEARLNLVVSIERAAYKLIEKLRPIETSEAELREPANKLHEMASRV
jgi:hypothetical protein